MALNKIILHGKIYKSPTKISGKGYNYIKFVLAVPRYGKSPGYDYFYINATKHLVSLDKYLLKDVEVIVEGSIHSNKIGSDTKSHYAYSVLANSISFTGLQNKKGVTKVKDLSQDNSGDLEQQEAKPFENNNNENNKYPSLW